jgi:hypothetical protein
LATYYTYKSKKKHRNNMGGNPGWDSRMMDSLKNFDLSSPDVKQQFGQSTTSPVVKYIYIIRMNNRE